MTPKSHLIQFLLNVLFGPLGLFYTSIFDAICGIILTYLLYLAFAHLALLGGAGIVPALGTMWVVSLIAGQTLTASHNKKIQKLVAHLKREIGKGESGK